MSRRKIAPVPPEPPSHLAGEAAEEWRRICSTEQGLDALRLDRTLVEAACVFAARWRESERQILATGTTVEAGNGALQQNPHVGIARAAHRDYRDCLDKLGLTPLRRRKRKPDDEDTGLSILDDAG